MEGPGKYDALLSAARAKARAQAAILVVLGGVKGNGFSVQGPEELVASLPGLLRHIAAVIEADIAGSTPEAREK
jgi:hypothetical protein